MARFCPSCGILTEVGEPGEPCPDCQYAAEPGATRPCPTCRGGSDEYYNTPGRERDSPCPRCNGSGVAESRDDGGEDTDLWVDHGGEG